MSMSRIDVELKYQVFEDDIEFSVLLATQTGAGYILKVGCVGGTAIPTSFKKYFW